MRIQFDWQIKKYLLLLPPPPSLTAVDTTTASSSSCEAASWAINLWLALNFLCTVESHKIHAQTQLSQLSAHTMSEKCHARALASQITPKLFSVAIVFFSLLFLDSFRWIDVDTLDMNNIYRTDGGRELAMEEKKQQRRRGRQTKAFRRYEP